MRKLLIFTGLLLTLILMFSMGCERKVINEFAQNLANDATPCFTCHSDQDFALSSAAVQWERSMHASGENTYRNRYNGYEACEKCHTNEGFLRETVGVEVESTDFTAIGCFTCHQPHTKGSLEQRIDHAVTLLNDFVYDRGNSNTCASCHQSRVDVRTYVADGITLNSRFGPHHGPQSEMLSGTGAYEYAGFEYDNSPHTNVAVSGCVECHMSPSSEQSLGGHSFSMANEDNGHENLTGCNASTCHNGDVEEFNFAADEDFDWDGEDEGVQDEIQGLLDSLQAVLETTSIMSDGSIQSVTVGDVDSIGAIFNFTFVSEDRSMGIHNTEYTVGLLQSSINFLVHGDPEGAPRGVAVLNRP